MAGPNFVLDKGFYVEGTAPYRQYTCVELGAGDQSVKPMSAAGKFAVGVIQEEVTKKHMDRGTGKIVAQIRLNGISACVAAAAITKGDKVAADADGRVKKATAGQSVVGVALDAAKAADAVVKVLLTPGVKEA